MERFRYVMVGGGMAADSAARAIRGRDGDGSLLMLSEEMFPPYDRPPLSKGLWKKGGKVENMWRSLDYETLGVQLRLGVKASAIDPNRHELVLDGGERIGYERLLLATGGRPRKLPGAPPGVTYFRTARDFFAVRRGMLSGPAAAVVGGGFIGAEMAAALALAGKTVHMAFPEDGVLGRVLPRGLSQAVTEDYRRRGVDVHAGTLVTSIRSNGESDWVVTTNGGHSWTVATTVAGLGIVPRTDLVEALGVPCPDGIEVDRYGATALPDVYAAGDVASFPAPGLGRRVRVEHEDHANRHGACVGENMAGGDRPYDYLPFFYSDLFDLGFEAVGTLDSRLPVVEDWVKDNERGVVFYVDGDRVVGVLAVDVWDRMDRAREIILEGRPVGDGRYLTGLLTQED
jgi:3-phenylpropionate/trans-cinnamate dioxygenase ferredoxin reductase subunit